MKNKKTIISIIIIFVLIIGLIIFLLNKDRKLVPYVEANNIPIVSAKKNYSNRVTPYLTDTNNNIINVEAKFEESFANYKFYDLKIEEQDENELITFRYDVEVPIKVEDPKLDYNWLYSYSIILPILFDYYTGEEYKVGGTDFINNDITWNGKKYQISVKKETSSYWDGASVVDNVYEDTNHETVTYYITCPKNYKGLMIGILKKGSTEESFKYNVNLNNRREELIKEEKETGIKSEELKQIEQNDNKTIKLRQSYNDKKFLYAKDDFYVFKVKDIEK